MPLEIKLNDVMVSDQNNAGRANTLSAQGKGYQPSSARLSQRRREVDPIVTHLNSRILK